MMHAIVNLSDGSTERHDAKPDEPVQRFAERIALYAPASRTPP